MPSPADLKLSFSGPAKASPAPHSAPSLSPASQSPAAHGASGNPIDRFIASVGSLTSLILHTIAFASFFLAAVAGWVAWDQMLLVLTTLLSLEAIYLAIFIQMSVNRQSVSLKEVEADVDAIQEHVEDLKEDVGDIQQDMEEITEDADEEKRKQRQAQMLEALTNDVKAMLKHIESLKVR